MATMIPVFSGIASAVSSFAPIISGVSSIIGAFSGAPKQPTPIVSPLNVPTMGELGTTQAEQSAQTQAEFNNIAQNDERRRRALLELDSNRVNQTSSRYAAQSLQDAKTKKPTLLGGN